MTTDGVTANQQQVAFDLGDLFAFLWQKKIRLVLTALTLTAVGGYYIIHMPKFYTASSTLLLGSSDNTISLPSSVAGFAGGGDSQMDTYIEFMRSRQFVEKVVLDMELHLTNEYQPAKAFGTEREQIEYSIAFFLRNLTLTQVGETDMLKVSYESRTPRQASAIVNYLGPAFFGFYTEKSQKKADDASVWLNTQLKSLEERLAGAEINLQEFMRENRLIDVKSQIELARTEISALMAEKLLNDKQLAGVEATVAQVRLSQNKVPALMQIPWFLQNPLVVDMRSKIVTQEQVLAELSERYKSKHHRYIAADTTLKTLRSELETLLLNLIAGLDQEFNTLKARSTRLENQIDTIKAEHSELGKHELQLARLRREVDSTQKLYEVFLSRLQETEILKDLGSAEDFSVINTASDPKVPSRPKVAILLVVLGIFSGFISIGVWLAVHLISDRHTRHRQLLTKMGVPILAEVPRLKKSLGSYSVAELMEQGQKNYQFAEAIRSLRTSVMMQNAEKETRIIVVTGITSGDGKSSLGISLAQSFAKLEKALLLDSDLRSPSIGKAFGLDMYHPGITELLAGQSRFSDCLHKVEQSQLSVMPSGKQPADPIVYISKPRFASIIKKLGILYERLVIQGPSVNAFSDSLVLSKYVDGVVLVCDSERTETADLLEGIQRLQVSGAPLLGVVFNRVKGLRNQVPKRSKVRRFFRKVISR